MIVEVHKFTATTDQVLNSKIYRVATVEIFHDTVCNFYEFCSFSKATMNFYHENFLMSNTNFIPFLSKNTLIMHRLRVTVLLTPQLTCYNTTFFVATLHEYCCHSHL